MWIIFIIVIVLGLFFYNKYKKAEEFNKLSPWEKYMQKCPEDYPKVLSLQWDDITTLQQRDLLQRIHSLNNEANKYKCGIDQLKTHYISFLKSKLNSWNVLHNEVWTEEKELAWLDFEYFYEIYRNHLMSSLKQENSYYTLCKKWAHEFYQSDYKSLITSQYKPKDNQGKSIYADFLISCITGKSNNELGLFLPEIELRQIDLMCSDMTMALDGTSLNPVDVELLNEDKSSLMSKREVLLRCIKPDLIENIIVRMQAIIELKKSDNFEKNQDLKDAIKSGNELLASTLKCINNSISTLNMYIGFKEKKK